MQPFKNEALLETHDIRSEKCVEDDSQSKLFIPGLPVLLGISLLAIIFVGGIASRVGQFNLEEETMKENFGGNWRLIMKDASATNHAQFQRMQAILRQVRGEFLHGDYPNDSYK